jgi:hypothetical protein
VRKKGVVITNNGWVVREEGRGGSKVNKEYRMGCRNLPSHNDVQDYIERRQKNWSTIKTMKTKEMV